MNLKLRNTSKASVKFNDIEYFKSYNGGDKMFIHFGLSYSPENIKEYLEKLFSEEKMKVVYINPPIPGDVVYGIFIPMEEITEFSVE